MAHEHTDPDTKTRAIHIRN